MNQFPGTCRDCGSHVPANGGNYHRKEAGRWTLRCRACIDACNRARATGEFRTYEEWRAAAASPAEPPVTDPGMTTPEGSKAKATGQ